MAVWWFFWALTLHVIMMVLVQEFRPSFVSQLLVFPRFFLEILFAFSFTGFLVFWMFSSFVPGYKMSRLWQGIGGAGLVGFVATMVLSFRMESPPSSYLGARPYCLEEVFVYGLVGILSFILITKDRDYPISKIKYSLMGLAAGMIPATLMEMACMYDPMHSIVAHFGPVIILGIVGVVMSLMISRKGA